MEEGHTDGSNKGKSMGLFGRDRGTWSGEKMQTLGLAEIHLACEPEQKQLISAAVDMTEAWEILARRHEAPSVANVMRLEQEFVSFRMSPTESIEKFITRAKSKAQELRAVGGDITASRMSNIILAGLPRDYLPAVTAMTTRPGDLWLEDVIDTVLSHEATLKGSTLQKQYPFYIILQLSRQCLINKLWKLLAASHALTGIVTATTIVNISEVPHSLVQAMQASIEYLYMEEVGPQEKL